MTMIVKVIIVFVSLFLLGNFISSKKKIEKVKGDNLAQFGGISRNIFCAGQFSFYVLFLQVFHYDLVFFLQCLDNDIAFFVKHAF